MAKKWRQHPTRRQDVRRAVDTLKEQTGCEDCGEHYPPRLLDYHHRDPKTKRWMISRAWATRAVLRTVLAEIQKCDLLCKNCHAARHFRVTLGPGRVSQELATLAQELAKLKSAEQDVAAFQMAARDFFAGQEGA